MQRPNPSGNPHRRRSPWPYVLLLAAASLTCGLLALASKVPFALPLLWPEQQRAFLQDGPGLLLTAAQIKELLDLDAVGREEFIARYLGRDPLPETPVNELAEGIRRRRDLVRGEFVSLLDERAKILFLHGEPTERETVDCDVAYKPLEIWTYPAPDTGGESTAPRYLVFYQPKPHEPYQLWLPIDSKRVLYHPEMEYWLEQWQELRGRIRGGPRFDRYICKRSEWVDEVTGVDGLFGFEPDRPKNAEIAVYLEPPDDLAAWARQAMETAAVEPTALTAELEVFFPEREGQRMTTQMVIMVPPEAELEPFVEEEKAELRVTLEGYLERDAKPFENFRLRYLLPPPGEGIPVALVAERLLRPEQEFLLRLKIIDEISGAEFFLNKGFVVPSQPTPAAEVPPVPETAIIALGEELKKKRISGYDSLMLVPPGTDVVFGLWRAEALVTGARIRTVVFYLDGKPQMTRRRPPFTAELRLATYPTEQVVRAEGYDDNDELVASDEVVVNQPRGELRVRIVEPVRGRKIFGEVVAKAEVVVPEEKRVAAVEFIVNEKLQARVGKPPWEATISVPPGGNLNYLTVTAELDDGARAEDVRFLNAPDYVDEIEVNLVELYTTVTDKSGRLVRGLAETDFEIWEDDRTQTIVKFELVENLPLTLGIVIDVSGSMHESLGEAQRAAVGFLENIITPRDRCFALAFADRPGLLMPRTSDVGAVAERLEGLVANGSTSLHDAIVTSLYYYRGVRGRRAMVLLSDGEDTSSSLGFREALEYSRRSGVAIFSIGLRIGGADVGVRRKLENLAQETGGRTFYIRDAAELVEVYGEIESELRSQYLVAYNSDQEGEPGQYHEVTIKVKGGKLKARTMRGYYS